MPLSNYQVCHIFGCFDCTFLAQKDNMEIRLQTFLSGCKLQRKQCRTFAHFTHRTEFGMSAFLHCHALRRRKHLFKKKKKKAFFHVPGNVTLHMKLSKYIKNALEVEKSINVHITYFFIAVFHVIKLNSIPYTL